MITPLWEDGAAQVVLFYRSLCYAMMSWTTLPWTSVRR